MASVLEAFQAAQSFTITNLNSLASSLTAGWGSAAVDNSSTLYLDALVQVNIAAVNTAPGSLKAFYVFAYGLTDTGGSLYTTTGATSGGTPGSQGALTFPSIDTNAVNLPLIGVIPYVGQNTIIYSPPFSVARGFGGILPQKWGVAIVNASNMTIAASGNSVQYTGVYNTVA